MNFPRVSIVLPTYNHLRFLPEAVESLLQQTWLDFELIIVNDGSIDGTRNYLDRISEPRIKVIHQENRRLPRALNAGFEAAQGEYLTWTSADNVCAPLFLETLVEALDANPRAGMAYSSFAVIDDTGRISNVIAGRDFSLSNLLCANPGNASFLYRRTCQETVGLYDPELEGAEDWDMWIRIVEQFPLVFVPELLYYYRMHADSMTAQKQAQVARASRSTQEKAWRRHGGRLPLARLYPGFEQCRDQRLAQVHGNFDFGTRLLRSPYGQADQAVGYLSEALRLSPGTAEIASNLAIALGRAGRWEETQVLIEQLKPSNHPVLQQVCTQFGAARAQRLPSLLADAPLFGLDSSTSELLQSLRSAERVFIPVHGEVAAEVDLNKPVNSSGRTSRNPEQPPGSDEAVLVKLLRQSDEAFARGDLESARAGLSQAISYAPGSPELAIAHGNILLRLGESEAARREFVKATVLNPTHAPAYLNLAATQLLLGQAAAAQAALRKVLDLEPDNLEALKLFGRTCLESELYSEGVWAYLETLKLNPQDVEAMLALAGCYAAVEDPMSARRLNEQVLKLDPSNEIARQALQMQGHEENTAPSPERLDQPAETKDLAIPSAAADPNPLVSVIVATYNRPEMLAGALESILAQTYPNIEIIVSNDAGVDVSAVIDPFNAKGTITYVRHGCNRGLAATRNEGLRLAKGKYVAYLDDDDRYYPEHIETLVGFLESSGYQAAYTDAYRAHQKKDEQGRYVVVQRDRPYSEDFDSDKILVCNFIPVLCMLHSRACLDEVGLFDEALLRQEDWELWLRLSRKYEIAHIPKVTCEFTWRQDGTSMSSGKRLEWARSAQRIYEKHWVEVQGKPAVIEAQAHLTAVLNRQADSERLLESSSWVDLGPAYPVDIVIPVYGHASLVKRCVESLQRTAPTARIILVDDASPDLETQRLLETYAGLSNMTVTRCRQNGGFIPASRRGAELGKAPFILFLNSDVEALEPGWLERLIPEEEDIAIVGARLLYPPDLSGRLGGAIQHAGVARLADGSPYHPFIGQPADLPAANTPRYVNAVTGACLLIRRAVWNALGGWDVRFGRGVFEDVDLCWQARRKGYRVFYQPAATLYHWESASLDLNGQHSLHVHSAANLDRLKEKWPRLDGDEALFFGEKAARKRAQARTSLRLANQAVERGNLREAAAAVRRAVKLAPDLGEALSAHGQILAARGDPGAAAEAFERALKAEPKNWKVWLKLIDTCTAAGQPERAAAWLAQLKLIFPDEPEVTCREPALAAWLPAAEPAPPSGRGKANGAYAAGSSKGKGTPAVQPAAAPSAAGLEIDPGRAAATLTALLEADDLPAALQAHAADLDAGLLALVQANARSAFSDGDLELADGLNDLADYIRQQIAVKG